MLQTCLFQNWIACFKIAMMVWYGYSARNGWMNHLDVRAGLFLNDPTMAVQQL